MGIEYHPRVRKDLAEILDWYDRRSDTAGDRFFADFEKTVSDLTSGKRSGCPINQNVRKINFSRFPYSLSYEPIGSTIFIFVVKHQKRHPRFGMERTRPPKT